MRIFLFIVMLIFICAMQPTRSYAVDKLSNKIKLKKEIEVPGYKYPLQITGSYKQIYKLKQDDWSAYKYGLEFATGLTDWLEYAVEYRYVENRTKKNGEEVENNIVFCHSLPFSVKFKDENKIVSDIREGDDCYENELELTRKVFSFPSKKFDIYLLLGNIAVYDFVDDRWSENVARTGLIFTLSDSWKFKIRYGYIDILDSSKNSSIIENELTYCF